MPLVTTSGLMAVLWKRSGMCRQATSKHGLFTQCTLGSSYLSNDFAQGLSATSR